MKHIINFILWTIAAFILISWLWGVVVWAIKLIEYFIWEANSIVIAAVVMSVVIWLSFTFAKYEEDEETEWESDGVHQDNL